MQAAQGELRAVSEQMQASEQQSQEQWRELLGKLQAKEAECQELSAASQQVSHSGSWHAQPLHALDSAGPKAAFVG